MEPNPRILLKKHYCNAIFQSQFFVCIDEMHTLTTIKLWRNFWSILERKFGVEDLNKLTNGSGIISCNNDVIYIDQKIHDGNMKMIDKKRGVGDWVSKACMGKEWFNLCTIPC